MVPQFTAKAYEEIVNFIAAGTSPASVISFQPSEQLKARVEELIEHEKSEGLSKEEKTELDLYSRRHYS